MPSLSKIGGLSLALLSVVAADKPKLAHRHPRGPVVEVVEYETVVKVITVTVPYGSVPPTSTPTPEPEVPVYHPVVTKKFSSKRPTPTPIYSPEPEPTTVQEPVYTPAPEPETTTVQEPVYTPAPEPDTTTKTAPAPTQSSTPPATGNQGPKVDGVYILEVANYWRAKAGKAPFTWDNELAAISQETVDLNQGGVQMVHHPGASHNTAEVICPGPNVSNSELKAIGGNAFEAVYTGWLCEVPTPELTNDGGINWCTDVVDNILSLNVAGQTGHADILNSASYSKIGCAYCNNPTMRSKNEGGFPWNGQWACNLL